MAMGSAALGLKAEQKPKRTINIFETVLQANIISG